jgi:hypothetical protein
MNRKEDYIAVFDSGVGGISVLRQLKKIMPNERYLYFGDSANAPYGSRPTGQRLEPDRAGPGEHVKEPGLAYLVLDYLEKRLAHAILRGTDRIGLRHLQNAPAELAAGDSHARAPFSRPAARRRAMNAR